MLAVYAMQPRTDAAHDGKGVLLSDKEVAPKAIVSTPIQSEPCNGTTLAEAFLQVALLSGAPKTNSLSIPTPA
jgi:hypothetical protein